MSPRRLVLALCLAATAVSAGIAGCGGGQEPVAFAQVQDVFAEYSCASCHPGVNRSLDLRPGKAYAQIVGVEAVEDPRLVRIVAGDPDRSFLFQKIAGDPALGDIPAIGSRMPQGAARMDEADIELVRRWIEQGAKNDAGKTVGPTVPTPGAPAASPVGEPATGASGDATIVGTVQDERHRTLSNALVTLLLKGESQDRGEEHYRVAVTDAAGRYELRNAPTGQYLLKAYAPRSIYVSRVVALKAGERATIDFGLPSRVVPNPTVSAPKVKRTSTGVSVSMQVRGVSLDPNYTLAVHQGSGRVFELRRPGDGPGLWSRKLDERLPGRWIFLAVDHQCNISNFVTATG